MAQVIATPTVTVSPAGGGTASYEVAGSGSFARDPTLTSESSQFTNYRYLAKPSPGFHFVRFDISSTISSDYGAPSYARSSHTGAWNPAKGRFAWASQLAASMTIGDVSEVEGGGTATGAAWWAEYIWGDFGYFAYWISALNVTAVFKAGTGQLVHSLTQGGALLFGADGSLLYDG